MKQVNSISITFPSLPPAELNPNKLSHGHGVFWRTRSTVSAAARGEGKIMGLLALQETPGWSAPELAELSFVFTFPNKRIHDLDGLITASKSWIDGVVDAGVIQRDDCWHLYIGGAQPFLSRPILGGPLTFKTEMTFRRLE